jgi:hypothetical protein
MSVMSTPATMSKSEREDMQRLVRQREKVFKSTAKQRSAELLADFENQMGQECSFDQDECGSGLRKPPTMKSARTDRRPLALDKGLRRLRREASTGELSISVTALRSIASMPAASRYRERQAAFT